MRVFLVGDSRSSFFVRVSSWSKETELAMVFYALGSFVVAFGFVAREFSFVVFQMVRASSIEWDTHVFIDLVCVCYLKRV